ncbi:hypothetical protein [Sandaracinus amylolyticus]|uniref:hypothetical protein n=1 Tax=Sandaracinus amylolyticus TaxID=927083 RepID=UPI001F2ECBDD|nr:hypothetical protein [Sandaracinus amylolyticus]UJR78940.1 Hypothetical protein I5071_9730 [Sandaracinus amylolyticus]
MSDEQKLLTIAEKTVAHHKNKSWRSADEALRILHMIHEGKGNAEIAKTLIAEDFTFADREVLMAGNTSQMQRFQTLRKKYDEVFSGKAGSSAGPRVRAASPTPSVKAPTLSSGSSFLRAFLGSKPAAEKVDTEAEKVARFRITERINSERGEIIKARAEAEAILFACERALSRLNEIEKLNVPGEDGTSVERLEKMLRDPNVGPEDRAEGREAADAHAFAEESGEIEVSESVVEREEAAPKKVKKGRR